MSESKREPSSWGFKDPRKSPLHRFSSFFCIPGTPIDILGVHNVGALKTHPKALAKTLNKYEVLVTIPHALESLCAGGVECLRSESGRAHRVPGGGWQYKVPHAHRHVRNLTPFPPRPTTEVELCALLAAEESCQS